MHLIDEWFNWTVAHRRNEENVIEAAERLLVTHSYLECRGKPNGRPYRERMVDMLKVGGTEDSRGVFVHRKIHKYDLMDLLLR